MSSPFWFNQILGDCKMEESCLSQDTRIDKKCFFITKIGKQYIKKNVVHNHTLQKWRNPAIQRGPSRDFTQTTKERGFLLEFLT